MEKKFIEKIYGNMGYNAYNTLQSCCTKSTFGLALAKAFLLENYPIPSNISTILLGITLAYSTANNILKAEYYTRDVTEIKKIYYEIIGNYCRLNKRFDFESPVEIYSMYNYLLSEGYLSKDKDFEFNSEKTRDIRKIRGAEVINGQAVCRHVASMLTDILNTSGIQSNVLPVYVRTPIVAIYTDSTTEKQTKEQLYDFVNKHMIDEKTRKSFTQLIDEYGDKIDSLSYSYDEGKSAIKRSTGNHAISIATKDGNSYFLDPTLSRMYKLSQNDNGILIDDEDDRIKICRGTTPIFASHRDTKTINANILLPSTTLEEDKLVAEKTRQLCKNNLDMFEQFYNDNSELYNELSDKLMGCKQQGKILRKIANRL